MTREEMAAAVGIVDVDALVLACLRVLAGSGPVAGQPVRRLSIDDVAERLNVSSRWLADECRAGRVEHVYLARKRFFTEPQVQRLLDALTVVPPGAEPTKRERALRSTRTRRPQW